MPVYRFIGSLKHRSFTVVMSAGVLTQLNVIVDKTNLTGFYYNRKHTFIYTIAACGIYRPATRLCEYLKQARQVSVMIKINYVLH